MDVIVGVFVAAWPKLETNKAAPERIAQKVFFTRDNQRFTDCATYPFSFRGKVTPVQETIRALLPEIDAIILEDYGKGFLQQCFVDEFVHWGGKPEKQ